MHDYIPRKIDINGQMEDVIVRQHDNLSRFLHVTLIDHDLGEDGGSAPFDITGCMPRLYVQSAADKNAAALYVDGEVADGEEGVMTFLIPGGITQNVGQYDCEIHLTHAADGSVISTKPFKLTVEQSLRDDEAIEASDGFTALDNALAKTDGFDARIGSNEAGIADLVGRMRVKGELALKCLGDSFVDYRSGLCWNCQGFAADEDYFYIYRASHEAVGHLQKLARTDLSTVKEADVELNHCNDMTVVTIDGTKYLMAISGTSEDKKVSLMNIKSLDILKTFSLNLVPYAVAAVKGSNTVYLSTPNRQLYTATLTLDGFSDWIQIEGISYSFNQGMDFDGGLLYGVNADARTIEIIDLHTKKNYHMKFGYLMQGYLLAEAESIVVFGDDVFMNGGTNSNDAAGISQTLICYGNLTTQVIQTSPKANTRNLDQPIALFASADSDDGDYDFKYRTGFSNAPFNSVYTAFLAAKSLFLLGVGSQFNIHVNVPIQKNIYLYGGGFAVILTSDIQNNYPADDESKIILHNISGIFNISVPTLDVYGGQINCTGTVNCINPFNGAIIFINSEKDFSAISAPTSNGIIIGSKKIFSRNGSYSMD